VTLDFGALQSASQERFPAVGQASRERHHCELSGFARREHAWRYFNDEHAIASSLLFSITV
jgi:hypothetical protein